MDAEKVKQEKAQRKADDALMEPARLAARGLTLEQIETDMKRRGIKLERNYIQRQIEKADRKRAAEEDEPFYAVNTQVRALQLYCLLTSHMHGNVDTNVHYTCVLLPRWTQTDSSQTSEHDSYCYLPHVRHAPVAVH